MELSSIQPIINRDKGSPRISSADYLDLTDEKNWTEYHEVESTCRCRGCYSRYFGIRMVILDNSSYVELVSWRYKVLPFYFLDLSQVVKWAKQCFPVTDQRSVWPCTTRK